MSIKHASSEPLPALIASGKWRFQIDDAQVELGSISLSELIQLVLGKAPLKLKDSTGGNTDRQGCNGGRAGHHTCKNVTMEELARILSQGRTMSAMAPVGTSVWLDRPVVDKTGLKGAYDFNMDYGRVGATGGRRGGGEPENDTVTTVPIADAVKGLGLSLEPSRQPFDILVIDHIERVPTEN